jgi:hypothetical protein
LEEATEDRDKIEVESREWKLGKSEDIITA